MTRLKEVVKRPLLRLLAGAGKRVAGRFDRPVAARGTRRVLVIQPGGIGDVLRVFPLIEQLQAAQPETDVGLLTDASAELLELYAGSRPPRLERFDLRWSYARKLRELMRLRRAGIDLVISPVRGDGMLECAVIAWLIGAPGRIGFEQDGAGFLYSCKRPFSSAQSILRQNLELLKPLGIAVPEARLRLRIPDAARAFAAQWYARHTPAGALRIALHPWSSSHGEFRTWPFSRYAELIERVLERRDATVLVLGSKDEARADRELLARLPRGRVHDLAGTTRLAESAALIAGCDLFIGNDSGLLHMALATGVRTVAVFGATAPSQVLHTCDGAVAVVNGVPCQPCHRHQPFFAYRCAYAFRCLRDLPVAAVLGEVLRVVPGRK